jgi:hypothetical protein
MANSQTTKMVASTQIVHASGPPIRDGFGAPNMVVVAWAYPA